MNQTNPPKDYETIMDSHRREAAEFERQRKGILYILLFSAIGWLIAFAAAFSIMVAR